MTIEEERLDRRAKQYARAIDETLDAISAILRATIFSLSKDHFAEWWPHAYEFTARSEPVAPREYLLCKDTSNVALKKLNTALQQKRKPQISAQQVGEARKADDAQRRLRSQVGNIPNEIFVPCIKEWLQQLSDADCLAIGEILVQTLDISGSAKVFLYVEDANQQKQFMMRLKTVYGIGKKQENDYKNYLQSMLQYRNHWYGHRNVLEFQTLQFSQFQVFLNVMRKIVEPLAGKGDAGIQEKVKRFVQDCDEHETMLQLPILPIAELAEELETTEDEIKDYLQNTPSSWQKDHISVDGSELYFVSKQEIFNMWNKWQIGKLLTQETQSVPEEQLEESVSVQHLSSRFADLTAYKAGKFTRKQLSELVDGFSILADVSTLMSKEGMEVLTHILMPELEKTDKRLLVDWGSLTHIYYMEKNAPDSDVRKMAKQARMTVYHLQKLGRIRYVGSQSHSANPDISLIQFVQNNARVPICVMTTNRRLIDDINRLNLPLCLCVNHWANRGLAMRSASMPRFAALCAGEVELPSYLTDEPEEASEAVSETPSLTMPEIIRTTPDVNSVPAVKIAATTPELNSLLVDEQGLSVRLVKAISQSGGEGTVYHTDRAGVVAKIYHTPDLCSQRLPKLQAMRKIDLWIPRVCWPTSLLYTKDGGFVGFLMQEAPANSVELGISVFKLTGETVQNKVLPHWDRLSVTQACISLCDTFEKLHKFGILMADINPRNLMVSPQNPEDVYFLDCDSYQVGEFTCPVGVAEYSSPEILRKVENSPSGYADCVRTRADEEFTLAILLFQMLLLGQYPFASKTYSNIGEAILNSAFAFKTREQSGQDAPDGPYRLIWNNIPPELKQMFAAVFTENHRYAANLWASAFRRYAYMLSNGRATRELLPRKYYDASGDKFVDFTCVMCKNEANMWKEEYERLTKYHNPLLCNQCRAILASTKSMPETVVCDGCQKVFHGSRYDKAMQEFGKRVLCDKCLHPTLVCASCRKTFVGNYGQKLQMYRRKPVYCPNCRTKENDA